MIDVLIYGIIHLTISCSLKNGESKTMVDQHVQRISRRTIDGTPYLGELLAEILDAHESGLLNIQLSLQAESALMKLREKESSRSHRSVDVWSV